MPAATPIFTRETFRFLRELAAHNRKEWMDANRHRYTEHIVDPFRRLLDELAPAALLLNSDFDTGGKTGKNFSRINRDIRFSKDKSPYRPQMYLMFSGRAFPKNEDGQLYVGVNAEGATVGFRIYGEKAGVPLVDLARPRAVAQPKWVQAMAKKLSRGYESYWYVSAKNDWVKNDGWPRTPEDWATCAGWVVRKQFKPAAVCQARFTAEVRRLFRELFPLYAFTSMKNWKA